MYLSRPIQIFFALLLICYSPYAQTEYRPHALVKVMPESPERLHELFQFDQLDLDEGETADAPYLFAYPEDIELLQREGYPFVVLQENVEQFYAERLGNNPLTLMGGYKTYAEIVAELDSIHAAYPEITTAKFSIGNSHQGRPMWVMKISDNPDVDENEPEVFYNTLNHPREIVTMEALFYFMHYLADNYGVDDDITELVNEREMYFLPCVNPDGHVYNQQTNPNGGGMWRKNRRSNDDGSFGVDLARNFSIGWGLDNEGSSPNPSAIAYRGPAPFSEPESQHFRDFVNSRHFLLSLEYHSYGNVYLFPWGTSYFDGDGLTADDATFRMVCDSMSYLVEQVYGTVFPYGTGWELYYNTNGNPFDWNYGDSTNHEKIISIAPELGTWDDGFWPTMERLDSIKVESLPANIFFARIAGQLSPPNDVTVNYSSVTNELVFRWSATGAPMYRIYASLSPDGPFNTLVVLTASTSAIIPTPDTEKTFYVVRSAY